MLCDGSAFTRHAQRVMETSLSLGVDACGQGLWDPDAAARIAQIQATGVVVSSLQKLLLSEWIMSEKIAGRWASIGRFYLPIWGNASANAICLKTGKSGSYAGTMTHGPGWSQSDGATGYFNFGATGSSLGMTNTTNWGGVLIAAAPLTNIRSYFMGASKTASAAQFELSGTDFSTFGCGNWLRSSQFSVFYSSQNGILIGARTSDTASYALRLKGGVVTTATGATTAAPSNVLDANLYAHASNSLGSLAGITTAKLGCYFAGTGVVLSDSQAFAANLKTLWEGCTGLALP